MSIIKVIQNIELERDNNKELREAVRSRMANVQASIDNAHSQVMALEQMLLMLRTDVSRAADVMLQEMDNRDEALRAIIEGDGHAGE